MSHKAWNDLTPETAPLVARGPQTLSVAPAIPVSNVMPLHVLLRVGEETDSQLMQLTPAEARRVAISLLQAAEHAETRSQRVRSN